MKTSSALVPLRSLMAAIAAFGAAVLVVATPALALAADGFEKVEGPIADNVPAVPFVGIAYTVIWLAVLGYVLVVARGLAQVNRDLADLRRKLDGAGAPRK